jgi:hypothetical protein
MDSKKGVLNSNMSILSSMISFATLVKLFTVEFWMEVVKDCWICFFDDVSLLSGISKCSNWQSCQKDWETR